MKVDPWLLRCVPDHFKTQEMRDKSMEKDPWLLKYVPDWFVTRKSICMWYDDTTYDDDEDNFLSGMMDIKNERLKKPQ